MKELSDLNLPENLRYSGDHEWARQDADTVRIGINDYAQDQLGEIVYVELPEVGCELAAGDTLGSVESVKAVSEIFLPVSGEILEVNTELEDAPELVNESCYDKGWIAVIKPSNPEEMDGLMDTAAYLAFLKDG